MASDTTQGIHAGIRPWHIEAGWLSGVRYDTIMIFGVLLIALASGALVIHNPSLFFAVLVIDAWLLGYHHVISTFTKLAGTAEDRRENRFLIYGVPVIVLASVIGLSLTLGLWSIITIYFFWQWFHYTRQGYGISVFYRRRAARAPVENRWALHLVMWVVPIWGILHRCAQGWDKFLYQPLWLPDVPSFIVVWFGYFAIAVVGWWVIKSFLAWREGTLVLGQTLFIASHITLFYTAYVLIEDINYGWLAANIWHNAQYILFVWLYNSRRFKGYQGTSGKVLAWISQPQPMRILMYFIVCLFMTTLFYGTLLQGIGLISQNMQETVLMLHVVVFQAVNFHHYVVDAYIWKARKKAHQTVMGHKASI